ncbi:MAG: oxidoreductase [Acidimicrobiales bacterium]
MATLGASTFTLAGRPVARVGFGAMQLPGPGVWGPPRDRETALAVLRRAVESGVNHIDTAQYYGPDVSNELIHTALHPYPEDLVLVSKVGGARDDSGGWIPAMRPEQLRLGVEDNLRSLERDRIDAVNLRLIGPEEGGRMPADQQVDFESQLAEMAALRQEGKIGGIGLSNVSLGQLRQSLEHTEIACVQNSYNVLQRTDEPMLQLCRERGVAWVPFFPLGAAFPGIPKVADNRVVIDVARRVGATPGQVGLAWLLAHADHILIIPGTSSLDHLEENVAVGGIALDAEALAALDGLAA